MSGPNQHSGALELEKRIPIVIAVDDNVTGGASSLGIAPLMDEKYATADEFSELYSNHMTEHQ